MTQLTLDAQLSKSLKTQGLDAAEASHGSFVQIMRTEAIRISDQRGWVTNDDLRVYADQIGMVPKHPNAWGAIWHGKGWIIVGYRRSAVPSSHARTIKIYTWRGGDRYGGQEKGESQEASGQATAEGSSRTGVLSVTQGK